MIEQTLFGQQQKLKFYQQAPLPFQGQKRNFLYYFIDALKEFNDKDTFVDLFGGSGFLSHTIKYCMPDKKVIFNDFDNYTQRLKNIDTTNEIITKIRNIIPYTIRKKGTSRDHITSKETKQKIIDVIYEYEQKGFVDYKTLSSNLLFSGKNESDFKSFTSKQFYERIKKGNYNADGYLQDVEVTHSDYKELFKQYENTPNVCFIVDPPYFNTDTKSYSNYWQIQEYFDVFKVLKNSSYFYFTSDKSQILQLFEALESNFDFKSPFQNTQKCYVKVTINKFNYYNDIMIYKH